MEKSVKVEVTGELNPRYWACGYECGTLVYRMDFDTPEEAEKAAQEWLDRMC